MPARSQAQRGYLAARFGEKWLREHHFDNKGPLPERVSKDGIPAWANYRPADKSAVECGSCDFYEAGRCEMFAYTPVQDNFVCDEWQGMVAKDSMDPFLARPPEPVTPDEQRVASASQETLEPTCKAAGALYLVSHAKTRYNQPGETHDIVQGWKNIPIDSTGRKQARKLGQLVKAAGVEHIFSSDLERGRQTAAIMGKVAGATVSHDRSFRPWNLGSFAGHSSSDVIPKLKPFMDEHPEKPVDGGESFDTYKDRFIPALEKLLKQVDEGKTIALVTHSRNVELAQGWLGGRGHRSKIDTSAISQDKIPPAMVFKVAPKGGKLGLVEVGDVSKGQAHAAELRLRVHGMSLAPSGERVYRMVTRDGHYVGRTNPSRVRARKGDTLAIRAAHFSQDPQGDTYWLNPVVAGQSPDAPHSWRDLEALAGAPIEKDTAAGPAGDIPAPGDNSHILGDGPTLSSVHVDAPLENISVAYATRGKKLKPIEAQPLMQILKADKAQQIVYGVVLEPHSLDSQDDFMLPQHVEKAAHGYLKKAIRGKSSVAKLQHRTQGFFKSKPGLVPVESFIAPCDFTYDGRETVKKGTWVMAIHIEDPQTWQDVLDGKYTGLSVGGSGIRRSMTTAYPEVPHGYMGVPMPSDWLPQPAPTG